MMVSRLFFLILSSIYIEAYALESNQTPPVVGHMPVFTNQSGNIAVSGELKLGGVLAVEPTKLGYSDKDNDLPDLSAFQYRWEIEGRGVVSTTSSMNIPNDLAVGGKLVTLSVTPVSQSGDPRIGVPLSISNLNAAGAKMGDGNGRITHAKLIRVTAKSLRPNGIAITKLPIYSNSQVVLEGLYDNGFIATVTDPIQWSSSAPGVVNVSSTGKALAGIRGKAIITGRFANFSSDIELTVTPWVEIENVGYFMVPPHGQSPVVAGDALNRCKNYVGPNYQIPGKPEPVFGWASAWGLPSAADFQKFSRVYRGRAFESELGWKDDSFWITDQKAPTTACKPNSTTGTHPNTHMLYSPSLGGTIDICPQEKLNYSCFVKW